MNKLDLKLGLLQKKLESEEKIRIAIFGLGSVGNYLLTYLLTEFSNIEVFVVGRSINKMICDVNVARISNGIRHNVYTPVAVVEADFNNIDQLASVIKSIHPDFIVNSSRAYSHIKYGSISWKNVRAYGIWTPLSVKFIKNIMEGVRLSDISPIIINTSYPDATNAWLRTGGYTYPDFGSGNLNHLIPRILFAIAAKYNIIDIHNIDITIATSHFHDILISNEGITEGVDPLFNASYKGKTLLIDTAQIYKQCSIPMPSDEKRNMMNASSNFEIIYKIIDTINKQSKTKIHSPGFCGMIGGYPVEINFTSGSNNTNIKLFDEFFSEEEMLKVNRDSIYRDGIENINNGELIYTDEIIDKTKKAFGYELPKVVDIKDSNEVANEIIINIIEKSRK